MRTLLENFAGGWLRSGLPDAIPAGRGCRALFKRSGTVKVTELWSKIEARLGRQAIRKFGLLAAATIFVLDQLLKNWILYLFDLPAKISVPVLPIFNLTMVWNDGVSFGLFSASTLWGRLALIVFALGVVGVLFRWLWDAQRPLFGLALGVVIGGAVGNALDRAIYGAVVDFFDFSALYFPYIFNLADAAISIGVVLLVWDAFFAKQEGRHEEDSASSGSEPM
ncbi:MAG: signal peptidase II [Alphaproteobacteria bacterium]|nr:MAG: signal peptidase II [Alphaproteobacteria bacterium]